jgi:hypothetical protein
MSIKNNHPRVVNHRELWDSRVVYSNGGLDCGSFFGSISMEKAFKC